MRNAAQVLPSADQPEGEGEGQQDEHQAAHEGGHAGQRSGQPGPPHVGGGRWRSFNSESKCCASPYAGHRPAAGRDGIR